MFEYRANMTRIYDADTIYFDIDLGFYTWLHDQSVRLYGINAWEVRGAERPKGLEAKAAVLDQFERTGASVVINTQKDAKEKYGRWLGIVTLSDGTILNDWLVANGHAVVNFYE